MSSKAKPFTTLLRRSSCTPKLPPEVPPSVLSIPFVNNPLPPSSSPPNAVVCPVGPCRSLYLFNSHFTSEELSGLAYRLKISSRNKATNSVLISFAEKYYMDAMTSDDDDSVGGCYVPRSGFAQSKEAKRHRAVVEFGLHHPPVPSFTGYQHPVENKGGVVENATLMWNLSELALCTHNPDTKVPLIFVAGGDIADGGYALSLCSHYTVCNDATSYRINNPLRGLSFDPVGLSFVLTRLGVDDRDGFVSDLSLPLARLLGLMGYCMDGADMVHTGMATHLVAPPGDGDDLVNTLEYELANMPSYEYQVFRDPLPKTQAEQMKLRYESVWDYDDLVNGKYKNQCVHELLNDVGMRVSKPWSDAPYSGSAKGMQLPLEGMVAIADALKGPLKSESLLGVIDGLKDAEADKKVGHIATNLLGNMNKRSPLALLAIDRLLMLARQMDESLESCVERERKVILNMMEKGDYKNWAKQGGEKVQWKHDNIKEVTIDEVEEMFA